MAEYLKPGPLLSRVPIDAYVERWHSQVKSQFERLPDPADHPVFRIEPAGGS